MSIAHRPGRRLPIAAAWPVPSSPAGHPWAVISAGLAPILLTAAYLMAGILQPSSYSPVRTTISAMAGQAGTDRWVMTGGIFLTGGCYPPHRRGPDRCPGIRPLMQFAVGLTVSVRPARRPHRLRRPWQHAGPTEKDDMTMTTDR